MKTITLVSSLAAAGLIVSLAAAPAGAQSALTARVTWLQGGLDNDARQAYWVDLQAGVPYVISGTCDDDCTDLDLQIFSPTDRVVAEDFRAQRRATVVLTPRLSGRYRVEVIMATCLLGPCAYAVAVVNQ